MTTPPEPAGLPQAVPHRQLSPPSWGAKPAGKAQQTLMRVVLNQMAARQKLASNLMPLGSFRADPLSFDLWVPLPKPWTCSAFIGHTRSRRIGIVASDAFSALGEAVRVCLGGAAHRDQIRGALDFMGHALTESPELASTFL